MSISVEEVRERLIKVSEEDYKKFNKSLMPGVNLVLGVRMPKIRQVAKEIAKGDFRTYLAEAKEKIGEGSYHEEIMMEGLVIAYAKVDIEEYFSYLDAFVPKIHNWAVCDCCSSTLKFMNKYQEESFAYIQKYLKSDGEYELRFGIVSLLDHFINEAYIDRVLDICHHTKHEGYYVKMAVAWTLSICYIKFPEKTRALLEQNAMDDFTHNKTIQKIRESYRVSKEEKEELKLLKRK